MDKYTATEQAYKNGYEKGYAAGKPKWSPVSEGLPDGECLAISMKPGFGYKEQLVGCIWFDDITDEYICECDGVCLNSVTHWMPMPEPPKEGE